MPGSDYEEAAIGQTGRRFTMTCTAWDFALDGACQARAGWRSARAAGDEVAGRLIAALGERVTPGRITPDPRGVVTRCAAGRPAARAA